MKKLYLIICMIAVTVFSASAQDDSKFTVYVGGGFSSIAGGDAETDLKFAYKVGASYDISCGGSFYITPGLEFANKGFKSDNVDGSINMFYVQVPVLAQYKVSLSDKASLGIKVGPYVAYGLTGSDIVWYDGGTSGTSNVFGDDGYDRFDFGLSAGVSFEFNKFVVGAQYTRGLIKLADGYSQFNQDFGLIVGYRF